MKIITNQTLQGVKSWRKTDAKGVYSASPRCLHTAVYHRAAATPLTLKTPQKVISSITTVGYWDATRPTQALKTGSLK
jgi:hypothetical protein